MFVTEIGAVDFKKNLNSHLNKVHTEMKVAWYNKKAMIVLFHALAWTTIYSLPFLIRTSNNDDSHRPPPEAGFLYFYIVTRFFWIGFFYLNALYLFPKLVLQKK